MDIDKLSMLINRRDVLTRERAMLADPNFIPGLYNREIDYTHIFHPEIISILKPKIKAIIEDVIGNIEKEIKLICQEQ